MQMVLVFEEAEALLIHGILSCFFRLRVYGKMKKQDTYSKRGSRERAWNCHPHRAESASISAFSA